MDGARRRRARRRRCTQFREAFDRAPRRLRRRAEVSAAVASCCSCCASTRAPATPTRATWCCARCARWRSAACAITSAAAFTATRSTPPGACRTSRRCCTTRRSSCSRISRRAQVSGDPFYAEVAEDTLRYVMREMTDAGGGFYSAEDADSVPPEDADDAARAQDGRRVLSVARRRARRAARRRRRGRQAAVRHRAGRQRAAGSAAGVHRQEPALRRAVDRRHRQARPASRPTRSSTILQPRAAARCSRRGSDARGRTSTTRC